MRSWTEAGMPHGAIRQLVRLKPFAVLNASFYSG